MDKRDIEKIFEEAKQDPELLSTIDVDGLLDGLENKHNDYLHDKTLQSITETVCNTINRLDLEKDLRVDYCNRLLEYRFVDELNELHKGKHVRWIRNDNNKLTTGGIVTDIKFTDNGTQILCMNSSKRFVQYKWDDCITFQKLNTDEQLILMAYDEIEKDDDIE